MASTPRRCVALCGARSSTSSTLQCDGLTAGANRVLDAGALSPPNYESPARAGSRASEPLREAARSEGGARTEAKDRRARRKRESRFLRRARARRSKRGKARR
ncbi:hypothetical protein PUN28_012579 [Cardiocondyla obscurior]|uniref:Uncharacterized protein n=1 Tax=Cardiocondyla obscurior TaxID=286306 RepID=A0AAW2FCC4_9HYME